MKRLSFLLPIFCFALSPLPSRAADFVLPESQFSGFPNTLGGRDFFVLQTGFSQSPRMTVEGRTIPQCRENISKVICLVDPAEEGQTPLERVCLPGGERYASHFELLYDNYPPSLQKMFCSLKRIFIEKRFFGTAFAGLLRDKSDQTVGAMIGIRQSVLDENLDLSTWASWKEQLSFGGPLEIYKPRSDLPNIRAIAKSKVSDFLYFVIAHEFGHLFDFANDLNKTRNCRPLPEENDAVCEMSEGSWGALSWLTNRTPKPENEFELRKSLCFYWCNGQALPPSSVPAVYESINKTSFISLYATTQPWDDFADSLAYDLAFRHLKLRYEIDTRQGGFYDIRDKLRSPLFAEKFAYIRNFLSRKDIVYP